MQVYFSKASSYQQKEYDAEIWTPNTWRGGRPGDLRARRSRMEDLPTDQSPSSIRGCVQTAQFFLKINQHWGPFPAILCIAD